MNPYIYDFLWMIEAFIPETGHRFTVDNIHDLPFVDAETAKQWCITWHKEFPHIEYKAIRYMKVQEERVN
jgi:hypothetical protein